MGQKAIIRFWWEFVYRLRPETISQLFADLFSTTQVRMCSAMVHFIRNNCLYFVCYVWWAQALNALAILPIYVGR